MKPAPVALTLIAALLVAGCGPDKAVPPAPTSMETTAPRHVHAAPHGGTLVEIGEHTYTIEFVRDAEAGKLSAYILDGHAENFIRIAAKSFDVIATLPGGAQTITLNAKADPATGEKVGDTSLFEGQADWLKTTPVFDAAVARLNIHGTSVLNIAFNFPKGNEGM
ncbi:MAG TPA: hypothetical protein VHO24_02135 [Opitutaceae bacterium]|nr:hypothetical protein [Opitutaceae bacterium]